MNSNLSRLTTYTSDAAIIFKALNGVFTVFKPADINIKTLKFTILKNLCHDLNNCTVRPPVKYVSIEGDTNKAMKVEVRPSYADHPLVVGPRYQSTDFKLSTANFMDKEVSGVLVYGINEGTKMVHKIKNSKPTRFYKIKGTLGYATDNYFKTGKVVEKSTYKHVKRGTIDKLCASMQSSHQRKMFELSGVDIQSQAAYELALQGPIRPADPNIPMIYTIKCVDFTPPEFTLEIVCINEYAMYLKTLIHDIGMQLHSTATCTQIQCIQYGLFNLNHALLKKHWDLHCIVHNIQVCQKIIDQNNSLLYQDSPVLVKGNV